MATYAAPLFPPKYRAFSAAGVPLAGGKVDVYLAGTTTRTNSYPTHDDAINGTNANANPVVLDANGEANIWLPTLTTGGAYKFVLSDSSSVVQWTEDNYTPATGFDTTLVSEWILEPNSATRISSTQFKFVGLDQTQTYHVGRRLKFHQGVYATITASAFVTDTTITVVGDAIPSPLISVSYGINSYNSPSYLDPRTALVVVKSGDQTNFSGGVKVTTWTVELDALSEWSAANNRWVCTYPGKYLIVAQAVCSDTGASVASNLYIVKNDTLSAASHNSVNYTSATAGNQTTFTASRCLSLAASDTIAMYLGAGTNTTVKADFGTILQITRVA